MGVLSTVPVPTATVLSACFRSLALQPRKRVKRGNTVLASPVDGPFFPPSAYTIDAQQLLWVLEFGISVPVTVRHTMDWIVGLYSRRFLKISKIENKFNAAILCLLPQ